MSDWTAEKGADGWSEPSRLPVAESGLVVDLDGFEGPLDLLLTLARAHKVDLSRISILQVADQYLAYIGEAGRRELVVAAEYLVMAAWLAYLKSRLLMPEPPGEDEPSGEELAAALAFRLRRLDAIRGLAARLADRGRLGRDVFARGAPENVTMGRRRLTSSATLHDLLSAYAAVGRRANPPPVRIALRHVWALADARTLLLRLIGELADWFPLDRLLAAGAIPPAAHRTALASTFWAGLELVREGKLAMRQESAFGRIDVRRGSEPSAEMGNA